MGSHAKSLIPQAWNFASWVSPLHIHLLTTSHYSGSCSSTFLTPAGWLKSLLAFEFQHWWLKRHWNQHEDVHCWNLQIIMVAEKFYRTKYFMLFKLLSSIHKLLSILCKTLIWLKQHPAIVFLNWWALWNRDPAPLLLNWGRKQTDNKLKSNILLRRLLFQKWRFDHFSTIIVKALSIQQPLETRACMKTVQ